MTKSLIRFGLLTVVISGTAYGQSMIQDSFIGARNSAVGNANISEYHDITSMYENPSTIAFLGNASVALNHIQGNYREMQENLAFPVVYDQTQMLAVSAQIYNLGEVFRSYTYSGQRLYGMAYELAYAHSIVPTLSVGGSVAFRQSGVARFNQANAASYSMGIDYVPSGGFSYGLTLGGLGTDVAFIKSGAAIKAVQYVTPRTIAIGATMQFPSAESMQSPFLIISMASEKIFTPSTNIFRGGIEYLPLNFLALRFGYVAGTGYNEPTFGVGFHIPQATLDFSFYQMKVEGSVPFVEQLSVSTEL